MSYPCSAHGQAQGHLPAELLSRLAQELTEHGLSPIVEAEGLFVDQPGTHVEARCTETGFAVTIEAQDVSLLEQVRNGFVHILEHADPKAPGLLRWTGDVAKSGPPRNMRFAEVQSVVPAHGNYLRIRLGVERIDAFTQAAMHFRLLFPPVGRPPVWPHIDDNGRVIWPRGEDALHRPAYTFVEIDPVAGWFSFDLFRHDGGRATEWALTAKAGDKVAVIGPGGGDFPEADWILLGGDETAIPAIRRILATSAPDRRGVAIIETADREDRVSLETPNQIEVIWLERGAQSTLWQRLRDVALPTDETRRFVWVGAEKSLIRKARAHFRDGLGLTPSECYLSAYWTQT